jgi:toxin YoeB
MKLIFTERAWADYLWFQASERKLLKKINTLIKDIQREPYEGLGKPEALKSNLSGYWSRRIDSEHRLVYEVDDTQTEIVIISCRLHYHK